MCRRRLILDAVSRLPLEQSTGKTTEIAVRNDGPRLATTRIRNIATEVGFSISKLPAI